MRIFGSSQKRMLVLLHSVKLMILLMGMITLIGLIVLSIKLVDPSTEAVFSITSSNGFSDSSALISISVNNEQNPDFYNLSSSSFSVLSPQNNHEVVETSSCATVEQMGQIFQPAFAAWKESLRVRRLIHHHFQLNGPSRVQKLPPEQFCRHGFVIAKASEAGFGNEMYKILTAAALSIMLNRSLIIGQTRGMYPFEDYITYSNASFTLKEVKHLWRKNGCVAKYGRHLVVRIDDFQKPLRTDILCSNWRKWQQPIIWLQNTTDAVAAQFFLKNVHPEMRNAAYELFGKPELNTRPNVFGELMRVLISPSESIEAAVKSVLASGEEPDITLHMRMLTSRSMWPVQAALSCIRKAMENFEQVARPKVVVVSDTPSFISTIKPGLQELAEVLHFDYKHFRRNISLEASRSHALPFRAKDWGPAPRWVAFVDFFLASRAKYAVVSGANRRVGTTYAQLIAALAAARNLDEISNTNPSFSFLSSFHSNMLRNGLTNQIGWGHAWNRFAGPLSCHGQPKQCAYTPLLPPGWWDGIWQSPITRDIRRLKMYGVRLSGLGTIDEEHLQSYCRLKKNTGVKVPVSSM
ncbi:uncharacterized protein LOC110694666 [Chenopodium quinoa]|uniref:uncharacterized protein LOC110694666 n=1 Tax=Chenopodium quinoa TaxID=63459 RepID=UPI000B76CE8C|nr:uncharacterized protein LOC110694666 [Chenopodium quinoa]